MAATLTSFRPAPRLRSCRRASSRISLRDLARPLLSAPASAVEDPEALLALRDWPHYLLARGWLSRAAYQSASSQARHAAVSLLTNGLTYPLTLSQSWDALGCPKRVTVVGARAEATMPAQMWQETCLLRSTPLALEMNGPAAVGPHEATVGRLAISIAEPITGKGEGTGKPRGQLFHESTVGRALLGGAASAADLPDAFVLFNPGFGEAGWERAWEPTVRALLASKRPVLLTALSTADAARDAAFWARTAGGGSEPEYGENSWRSLLSADGTAQGCGAAQETGDGANRLVALVRPPQEDTSVLFEDTADLLGFF